MHLLICSSHEHKLACCSLAAEVHPLHPEVRGLLIEIVGRLHPGDISYLQKAIEEAEAVFDAMDRRGLSDEAIASVYHKLGTAYLSVSGHGTCLQHD
jgi:hypothetical protein